MKPTAHHTLASRPPLTGAARLAASLFALLASTLALHAQSPSTPASPGPATPPPSQIPIYITPQAPTDTLVPASQATLVQAAQFAWQQFIAANWPALPQTGAQNTRGVFDPGRNFGDQSVPLVWHTYRSKVENFPWPTQLPPGTTIDPTTNSLVFNFDAPPQYFYQNNVAPGDKASGAQPTAWINLDETTQIALNQLFAGSTPVPFPGPTSNSQPQQFRYLAKTNRTYFNYIAAHSLFNQGTDNSNPSYPNGISYNQYLLNYTNAIAANKQPVLPDSVIQLPVGTIMIKSAWRLLGPKDQASHYHTTTVRFYEKNSKGQIVYYQEQNWGMVALHIVVKTPSAPAFIFATFEQADNLRLPDGTSIEDADGRIVAAPPIGIGPTTPTVVHTDSPTGATTKIVGDFFQPSASDQRLFLRELAPSLPKPTSGDGAIAVNTRFEPIPPEIIAVNQAAHAAIAAYDTAYQVPSSPWLYYKLINVQATPLQRDATPPPTPATFFQANSVVETDYTLGQFSGVLVQTGALAGETSNYSNGQPAINVNLPLTTGSGYASYNSGGCMGCHGNAQRAGTDFSFTLNEGPAQAPDIPLADAYDINAFMSRYGIKPTTK